MNVTIEDLSPCRKLLRFEVDAADVDKTFDQITADFQRQARLPGFRAGKAPRHLVVKTYAREIEQEVRRKMVSETYQAGVRDKKLRVVTNPEIEEIQFGRGQGLQFAATIETAPDFELPEYKGIAIKREMAMVTEQDVDRAMDVLREQKATYIDVARPVQDNDYVVVNYTATTEGKPLTDIAPTARGLTAKENFWIHIQPDSFIPGFAEQLVGAQAGEKRTVPVTFPADFVAAPLSGRPAVYEVDVLQVKEKILPPVDDAFAQGYGAADTTALREGIRKDLQNELNYKQKRSVRDQLVKYLLGNVTCELPESVVLQETRNVVYDIVRENTQRGIDREAIDGQKDQIFNYANNSAKERVKSAFILGRIAEKEGIRADEKEITQRILQMAEQHEIAPDKLVRQLQERNGIAEVRDQIVTSKVLDFLELNAQVEEVLPGAMAPAPESAGS